MAIPNQTTTMHHVGSVLEDISMSMRAEDFPHIADLLNGLYSDTIAAPVREYCTNAIDSHISAGQTRPIEVTLPTSDSLEFVVQDFGLGMSVDDLRQTYSMYGRSDKRGSNAVAGMLGLGSKSGLSYATGFSIVAVRNGVRVEAFCTKDAHGLGCIKILDTKGTDEHNGVRISIPVDRWHVDRFREAAHELFQFWEPGTVLIDGEAPEVPAWRETALALDDDTWLIRDDAGLYRSYVVTGNVPYPVPDAKVGRSTLRFVARLNMGDVDFVPSREEVKHTPHTDETLADLTAYIAATYKRAIDNRLAAASSRWDEAVLKCLWMDRNLRIETSAESPIWHFDPNGYGHAKAKSHFKYRLANLAMPHLVVITGFPSKNVSTVARDRLLTFAADQGITKPTFVIFPSYASTGVLDGRPRTFTWVQVAGATEAPKADKKARQARYETRYAILGGQTMTADELSKVNGKVLYLEPNQGHHLGDLGATIVMLRSSNQIARLMRLVPGIDRYSAEVNRQRAKAEAAVTDHDRAIVRARTLPDQYKRLNPDDVADVELAEAIRLCNTADTATMVEARRFGVQIEAKSLSKIFEARYPLLHAGGYYYSHHYAKITDEVLFYINAKVAADQAALIEALAS